MKTIHPHGGNRIIINANPVVDCALCDPKSEVISIHLDLTYMDGEPATLIFDVSRDLLQGFLDAKPEEGYELAYVFNKPSSD